MGLNINVERTEYMIKGRKKLAGNLEHQLENNRKIEINIAENFIYLDIQIAEEGNNSEEIRVVKGNKYAGTPNKILRSKNIWRNAKLTLQDFLGK